MLDEIATRICEVCGDKYTTVAENQKYCSSECAKEKVRRGYTKRGGYSDARICDSCGNPYMAINAKQRFCSASCRSSSVARSTFFIYNRDGFRCIYCGRTSVEFDIVLNPDHILPVNLGGTDTAGNLITSCSDCNSAKGCTPLPPETYELIVKTVHDRNIKYNLMDNQVIKMSQSAESRRDNLKRPKDGSDLTSQM